jgi:hypothetical protein
MSPVHATQATGTANAIVTAARKTYVIRVTAKGQVAVTAGMFIR